MKGYVQIFTTTGSKKDATKIAGSLIAKRLAACVQVIGPITSTYRWEGKIETSVEWMCMIKSRRASYAKVEKEIKRIHPYELPEITMFDMSGSKEYLSWMEKNTVK